MTGSDGITALILAAGYSSRMGDFKPLLKLGDRTAIEHTIRLFAHVPTGCVKVVTGYRGEVLKPILEQWGIAWIENPRFEEGMFSSVKVGVRSLNPSVKAFFLLPTDIPLVRRSTVRALMDAFGKSSADVVYPCFHGHRGHPPLISTRLCRSIVGWDGDGGLRAVLGDPGVRSVDVEVADEWILSDMDTPEHYDALQERMTDYDIPSVDECKMLLVERCSVDRKVLVHSCKVAQVAYRLCRRLKDRGCALNEKLVLATALLHDLARGRPNHATEGARILRELGFGRVAELVAVHMDCEVQEHGSVTEIDVIRMADRMVQEDRVVGVEERFREKLERHKDNDHASEAVKKKFIMIGKLRQKIEEAVGGKTCPGLSGEYEQPDEISAEHLLAEAW